MQLSIKVVYFTNTCKYFSLGDWQNLSYTISEHGGAI